MDTKVNDRPMLIDKPLKGLTRLLGTQVILFAIAAFLFGIAYTQDPIYYSPENQNTKYLQGLARAGYGFLNNDWTANTIDPLPVFTALVQFTYQFFHPEYGFYLWYFLVFGAYAYSLIGIASEVFPLYHNRTQLLLLFALLVVFHTLDVEIFGFNIGKHLHYGVAEQYILGPVFQPCNFGVFLLISIYAFLRDCPYWAVACLAIAGSVHPAYFPSVAALTVSYMGLLAWQERHWQKPLLVGIVSGMLIFPVFAYMTFTFQDTTPELTRQATNIIVNQRIPHHSIPAEWLDGEAYIQTVIVAIALYFVRQTRLFYILLPPYLIAVLLTIVQMVVSNDFLAFIAPWRISAFLVPVATAIILGQVVATLFNRFPHWTRRRSILITRISLGLIVTMVIMGGIIQVSQFQKADGTFAMMNYIKATKQPGETYLVQPDAKELRKFRLYTGAPIFINRKTHPYKDVEVIEWNRRLELGDEFYRKRGRGSCEMLRNELQDYAITHVVLPAERIPKRCKRLTEQYRDEHYGVYSTEKL